MEGVSFLFQIMAMGFMAGAGGTVGVLFVCKAFNWAPVNVFLSVVNGAQGMPELEAGISQNTDSADVNPGG